MIGHDDAVRRVGTVVVPEPHVQREQPALVVEADGDLLQLAALVRRRHEVLAAVLDPLDLAGRAAWRPTAPAPPPATGARSSRRTRRRPSARRTRPCRAAARASRRPRRARWSRSGSRSARASSRRPASQRACTPLPSIGIEALRSTSRRQRQGVRRGGQRGVDVADLVEVVRGDVVGHVVVHGALGPTRVVDADHRREHVVGDDDPLGGVLGEVAVPRDHHHDGLADVVDLVAGQRVAGARRVSDGCGMSSGSGWATAVPSVSSAASRSS